MKINNTAMNQIIDLNAGDYYDLGAILARTASKQSQSIDEVKASKNFIVHLIEKKTK